MILKPPETIKWRFNVSFHVFELRHNLNFGKATPYVVVVVVVVVVVYLASDRLKSFFCISVCLYKMANSKAIKSMQIKCALK